MTLSEIATKARALVNANTTTYPNANLLIDLNLWYQKVATMIYEAQDDADFDDQRNTDYPIVSTPFTLNGTDNLYSARDYSIPVAEKMLKFKRLDVTYDGVTWYEATPIDSSEIPVGQGLSTSAAQELVIDGLYSKNAPRFDLKYGSIFVYPRATNAEITAGAKMRAEWYRQVTPFTSAELTTGTVVPGFDDPFHPILAYGCALEQAKSKNLPQKNDLLRDVVDYEARIKQGYSNKDRARQYYIGADLPDYGSKGRGRFYLNNNRG